MKKKQKYNEIIMLPYKDSRETYTDYLTYTSIGLLAICSTPILVVFVPFYLLYLLGKSIMEN